MTLRSFEDADSDEARQFLLDRHGERVHPKRHRTRKRSAKATQARKQRVAHRAAVAAARRAKYHAAVESYWRGERDAHP